jgi:hypothetical protein
MPTLFFVVGSSFVMCWLIVCDVLNAGVQLKEVRGDANLINLSLVQPL